MADYHFFSEKQLLGLLAKGDEKSFTTIYRQHAPALTAFAAARLDSLEHARDMIHDLFVYLWEERDNISITHSLKAFLFAALRFRIIDHIRHRLTEKKYQAMVQNFPAIIQDHIEAKDLEQTIQHAILELPPRTREIYELSRHQHLTSRQIAEKLSLSEQTVRNQISTALNFLRLSLDKLAVLLFFIYL